MNKTLFIPKKIKVGIIKRNDTYDKKLGYVTYIDENGVHRKKKSLISWIQYCIRPQDEDSIQDNIFDFDNIPLAGFVLNKNVGGSRERNEYVRVYDPRGFEVEITITNLLYILTYVNSTKGRGLTGEFVYAWINTLLFLLPKESPDYKSQIEFSNMRYNKQFFTMKNIIQGATYLTKSNQEWVYLGRYGYHYKYDKFKKAFYFYDKDCNRVVDLCASLNTKLLACIDECKATELHIYMNELLNYKYFRGEIT